MSKNKLQNQLVKYGSISVMKEGYVFTLLMIGDKMTSSQTVMGIQKLVLDYAGEKYPILECMRNEDHYLLIVLKPKS